MVEKLELVNYTLRLPEEYRKRLEIEALSRGSSLNQQIVRVLEIHFASRGYGRELVPSAGQMFKLNTTLAHNTDVETVWHFALENYRTGNEEAFYDIGIEDGLCDTFGVKDPPQAAKEIGLAIIELHGRRGRDIRSLCWTQNPTFDNRRVLSPVEVPDHIRTLPDFVELLSKGLWEDRYLIADAEMNAIQSILMAARLQNSDIHKYTDDTTGDWIGTGSVQFDAIDRGVYVNALTKMGTLGLLELQQRPATFDSRITYRLLPEANYYLAKLASLAPH